MRARGRDRGCRRGTTKSRKHPGWAEQSLFILCVNYFRGVRRIRDKERKNQGSIRGSPRGFELLFKESLSQLGFPNIIPLPFARTQYLDSHLPKIREIKSICFLMNHRHVSSLALLLFGDGIKRRCFPSFQKINVMEISINKFILLFSLHTERLFANAGASYLEEGLMSAP